jgi:hypothetical protein
VQQDEHRTIFKRKVASFALAHCKEPKSPPRTSVALLLTRYFSYSHTVFFLLSLLFFCPISIKFPSSIHDPRRNFALLFDTNPTLLPLFSQPLAHRICKRKSTRTRPRLLLLPRNKHSHNKHTSCQRGPKTSVSRPLSFTCPVR